MDSPEDSQVDKVTHKLRKPETRSEFTTNILANFHLYFEGVFNQDSPPELIQQFKERQGIIFPVGSMLRGTARVGSDFDFILLYDDPFGDLNQHPNEWDFIKITQGVDAPEKSSPFHPSGLTFRYWNSQKFYSDPTLTHFVDDRRTLLKNQVDAVNKHLAERGKSVTPFRESDVEANVVGIESEARNTQDLIGQVRHLSTIDPAELDKFRDDIDTMAIIIPQLLTSSLDHVVESTRGNLLHHQRRFVEELSQLEQQNPEVFKRVYDIFSANFKAAIQFQSTNHAHVGNLDDQRKQYIEKSGRFPENQIDHAAELLKGVAKQTEFPSFQSFKTKFLAKVPN